jgi:hypothetical protein
MAACRTLPQTRRRPLHDARDLQIAEGAQLLAVGGSTTGGWRRNARSCASKVASPCPFLYRQAPFCISLALCTDMHTIYIYIYMHTYISYTYIPYIHII